MTTSDFLPKEYTNFPEKGTITCYSPSNIALVKYWGKYGEQYPQNASISFTLNNCRTETTMHFKKIAPSNTFNFEVFLNGNKEASFEPKIRKFFERVVQYIPFLKEYHFTIETKNTFPHSSGIASSASGMSALAMCLVTLEPLFYGKEATKETIVEKASFLARLGSGSASRSLQGPLVVWGEHPKVAKSSNLIGVKYTGEVHSIFKNYQDTILLVDKGEKQVSSTVGHDLMNNNPYASARFKTANENISKLLTVLKNGDISSFIAIVESEALQLHGMMMASEPYFILMKPNTLHIINHIWQYRAATNSNVCFTLDAGANVHVLYPENEKDAIVAFIKSTLVPYCKNGEFIEDHTGTGAVVV